MFSVHGRVTAEIAKELGIPVGTPVTYKAGDQPNNALSLRVTEPGEIAATAGTSGVIYAVSDQISYDPLSRVNSFAHVNHSAEQTRIGILLCINGTGILNRWVKNTTGNPSYQQMNDAAAGIPIGSIESTSSNLKSNFHKIKVKLATDFSQLDVVSVVRNIHQKELDVLNQITPTDNSESNSDRNP